MVIFVLNVGKVKVVCSAYLPVSPVRVNERLHLVFHFSVIDVVALLSRAGSTFTMCILVFWSVIPTIFLGVIVCV